VESLPKNLICTGIDDNYLWPWMVSMYSAKVHASGDFSVNLGYINGTLQAESIRLIEHFCSNFQIKIQIREFGFDYDVQVSHIPIQAYIRILWLDALAVPFLWLDSDTLLLENWEEVFTMEDDPDPDIVLYAALDSDIIAKRLNKFPNNLAYRRGGIHYFNDGVFLAFPENWKAKQFHLQWAQIASRHVELGFEHHEQDVLNYLTFENKGFLDPSFNSLVMQGSKIGQKILHFTGQPKPWHFDETARNYFTSIEFLKGVNGNGAFGGVNWLFEYQNYWRHEDALLKSLSADADLQNDIRELRKASQKPLIARRDWVKYKLLLAIGRKWNPR